MVWFHGRTKLAQRLIVGSFLLLTWSCILLIGGPIAVEGLSQKKISKVHRPTRRLASITEQTDRRSILRGLPQLLLGTSILFAPRKAFSLPPAGRDVDVGGGTDLLNPSKNAIATPDVQYPPSMQGRWAFQKVVVKVDGDKFQAEQAYRCLENSSSLQEGNLQEFETKYVLSPFIPEGSGVVVDRGFELASKIGTLDDASVQWTVENPNRLEYRSNSNAVKIVVVKRSVEIPTEQGFGFDELLRIEDGYTTRAVQVKRRYRRAFDEKGNRVVEGLEIMKTFRVLDGIAGTEFPTSTVKSQLRLVRPPN